MDRNKLEEIKRYVGVIKRACSLMEPLVDELLGVLVEDKKMMEPVEKSEKAEPYRKAIRQQAPVVPPTPVNNKWEQQRKKHVSDLLAIPTWPEAVPPFLVASATPSDKIDRANAVLDYMVGGSLDKKSFLDFGCGEGWIARQAVSRGVTDAVGYDIVESPEWVNHKTGIFTTNVQDLRSNYFDVVFMYSVIDNCENQEEVMKQVYEVTKNGGTVYVRCWPWVAKHGTQLYKKGLNKSFIHLFLTKQEIEEIVGPDKVYHHKTWSPIKHYRELFSKDFSIVSERVSPSNEELSPFFLNQSFKDLLKTEHNFDDAKLKEALESMKIEFVDYVLSPIK